MPSKLFIYYIGQHCSPHDQTIVVIAASSQKEADAMLEADGQGDIDDFDCDEVTLREGVIWTWIA